MPTKLIEFWNKCEMTQPLAHPDDLNILRKNGGRYIDTDTVGFDQFINSKRFGDFKDNRLHLSLVPVPFLGDLRNAKIVILLLNPGFAYADYWAESKCPEFKRRLIGNLKQSFELVEFPFLELDPQFCWYGGFIWWEKKLRGVMTKIANKKYDGRYLDAIRDLSKNLACVELVPYHSPFFHAHSLIEDLASVNMVRKYVQESLFQTQRPVSGH